MSHPYRNTMLHCRPDQDEDDGEELPALFEALSNVARVIEPYPHDERTRILLAVGVLYGINLFESDSNSDDDE